MSRSPLAREQDEAWARFAEEAARDLAGPFDRHWSRFGEIFDRRRPEEGPPLVWRPRPEHIRDSNVGRYLRERGFGDFDELHRWSIANRAEFWADVVDRLGIAFTRTPRETLDPSAGPRDPRWLPGAELNCVDSCFTADPEHTAIVSGGEGQRSTRSLTYRRLELAVDGVARGLREQGFGEGDAIALFLPMTADCVAAYLGIVRAGCAVVSIADSFSAKEVARRLSLGNAKAIVTMDRFERSGKPIELYERVQEANGPRAIVIPADPMTTSHLRDGDLHWADFCRDDGGFASVSGDPYRIINILFSSGTTGEPKAVPWTHLTSIKCAMDGHFHQDIRPGDVVAWPTNVGWMMGPWLIYATLINGGSIALYDGAPNGEGFVRFIQKAGVSVLGVVPSLVRAWRSLEPWPADWSRVRVLTSTGEPSNPEDYLWLMSRTGYRAPVIEYCGGTEIGGGYVTGTMVQPASPATFTTPALGLDLVLLDEAGRAVAEGEPGEVFLVPPSIGLSQTLLNRDHDEVYHAGCPAGPRGQALRRHGDRMRRLPQGFFEAEGRADDTMNLGGIKVGSLELERIVSGHASVRECAAVSVRVGGGPERLVLFVVPAGRVDGEALKTDLQQRIATELNPLFKIHDVVLERRLPYTASNKLMRRELRSRYVP
jgi:acetyl-CoA synthetase